CRDFGTGESLSFGGVAALPLVLYGNGHSGTGKAREGASARTRSGKAGKARCTSSWYVSTCRLYQTSPGSHDVSGDSGRPTSDHDTNDRLLHERARKQPYHVGSILPGIRPNDRSAKRNAGRQRSY